MFPFSRNQIVTVDDLLALRPRYSRSEMQYQLIDALAAYDYSLTQDLFGRDMNAAETEAYLNSLTNSEVFHLFQMYECYGDAHEDIKNREGLKSEDVIQELIEYGFNCVGHGTVRRVFDLGDWVLKVPYLSNWRYDEGVGEGSDEVKLYERPSSRFPPMAPVIPLRYEDRSGYIHEGINLMKKINVPNQRDTAIALRNRAEQIWPDFTISSWSIEHDDNGNIMVYDFG